MSIRFAVPRHDKEVLRKQWGRVAAWLLLTTIPIYLMLTIFMPDGFAGVPWMLLVMLVLFGLFGAMMGLEPSWFVNAAVAFLFWSPMLVLHLVNPGTAALRQGTVHEGALGILAIATCHSLLQIALKISLSFVFCVYTRETTGAISQEGHSSHA